MRRNPQVIWDVVDGVMVLLHTGSGELFELNATAAFAWSACEALCMEDLSQTLRDEYPDVDPTLIDADCQELVAMLKDNELVVEIAIDS